MVAVIVVQLFTTKGNLPQLIGSCILFAAAVFTTLCPTWWSTAIAIVLLTIFTIACLRYVKDRIKTMYGVNTISCYLIIYTIELALCIVVLSTNWCWYVALVYMPIAIALVILGLLSSVVILAIATALATE
jgi:hypothetical protein